MTMRERIASGKLFTDMGIREINDDDKIHYYKKLKAE